MLKGGDTQQTITPKQTVSISADFLTIASSYRAK